MNEETMALETVRLCPYGACWGNMEGTALQETLREMKEFDVRVTVHP